MGSTSFAGIMNGEVSNILKLYFDMGMGQNPHPFTLSAEANAQNVGVACSTQNETSLL
jgi:hypothetical protein